MKLSTGRNMGMNYVWAPFGGRQKHNKGIHVQQPLLSGSPFKSIAAQVPPESQVGFPRIPISMTTLSLYGRFLQVSCKVEIENPPCPKNWSLEGNRLTSGSHRQADRQTTRQTNKRNKQLKQVIQLKEDNKQAIKEPVNQSSQHCCQ